MASLAGKPNPSIVLTWVMTATSVAVFNAMFSLAHGNIFWLALPSCTSILAVSSLVPDKRPVTESIKRDTREILRVFAWGLGSALALYCIFLLGNQFVRSLTSFGGPQIRQVYGLKSGMPPALIALLMIVFIGPAEEIFWRAFVQRRLAHTYGTRGIIFSVIAYMLAHASTANPMLMIAALICGAFWAMLFKYRRSVLANVISHAVWDVMIFVICPLE